MSLTEESPPQAEFITERQTSPLHAEWPTVPKTCLQYEIIKDSISAEGPKEVLSISIQGAKGGVPQEGLPHAEVDENERLETQKPITAVPPIVITQAQDLVEPSRRQSLFQKLKLTKPPWPDPELSLGNRCDRLRGYDCWEACGPAASLFLLISESIGKLLDAKVGDIEKGEPEAGSILTFGMYMVGKGPAKARPTLVFTCRSTNSRKRAMDLVKRSTILDDHPEIALAQSSMKPSLGAVRI